MYTFGDGAEISLVVRCVILKFYKIEENNKFQHNVDFGIFSDTYILTKLTKFF